MQSEAVRPQSLEERRRKDDENHWYSIIGKCAMSTITYPLEYVRVLIQLGYEPIEPIPTRRLFGKPALMLPGALAYMGYIRGLDGFTGLYRGYMASVCGTFISATVFIQVNNRLPAVATFEEDQVIATEEEQVMHFLARTTNEMLAKTAATIVSHPLHVVAVRTMAQFVGGESKYRGVFGGLWEIVNDEGVSGLFSGLVPRLSGEILRIWLAGTVAFFINTYIVEDASVRHYISATTAFLASSLTYPFHVVGTVMAVTGAPIEAGGPPHLARYDNSAQCWQHLSKLGQLKRGSSMFWRYYLGPMRIGPDGIPNKIPIEVSILTKMN